MKPVSEWKEEDVLAIPAGEHDWVEMKGRKSLDVTAPNVDINKVLNELSKQISAFANAGGGTIVYGIKDANPGTPREVDDGGISLNIHNGTKAWLEDVIPHLVEFELRSFNVYIITKQSPQSQLHDDRGIVLVEIADSDQAPHQARDRKYYARMAGRSCPIGHRMVADIFGRSKLPKITLTFDKHVENETTTLRLTIVNSGRVYANYVMVYLYLPEMLQPRGKGSTGTVKTIDGVQYKEFQYRNIHKDLVGRPDDGTDGIRPRAYTMMRGAGSYYVTRYDPLLPYMCIMGEITLGVPHNALLSLGAQKLRWNVFADNYVSLDETISLGAIVFPETFAKGSTRPSP